MNVGIENETLEFKKSTSELTEGVISLAAMLNKHGEGTVYFGVKNNGDVIGQKDFKEAWLNACVHTRWIEKIPPAVYIFDDRIEIVSNGGLPKALNKEDFFRGVSKPVNTELLNIFVKLDIIDQTGHGVPLILKEYGKEAFYISDHTIIVTIPINKKLLENIDVQNTNEYFDLNPYEIKVFNCVKENCKITVSAISSMTGLSESYSTKIIRNLKIKGYIERIGSRKTGYWKIIK